MHKWSFSDDTKWKHQDSGEHLMWSIHTTYDMYFDIKTKEKNLPSFSVLC